MTPGERKRHAMAVENWSRLDHGSDWSRFFPVALNASQNAVVGQFDYGSRNGLEC